MDRIDLADPSAGILATLEGHHPLAVFERGGVEGEVSFELETQANGRHLNFEGDPLLGNWSVRAQLLRGRLRAGDGSTTPIEAIGAASRGELATDASSSDAEARGTNGDPAVLRRQIVICLEDGGLLAIVAARAAGRADHGRERIAAALASPDGETTQFPEVRLSTEYGPEGDQRRATLELWPADDRSGPVRGAGVAVAGTEIELPGARSRLVFFEWSVAGCPAIGRYEIIRTL